MKTFSDNNLNETGMIQFLFERIKFNSILGENTGSYHFLLLHSVLKSF